MPGKIFNEIKLFLLLENQFIYIHRLIKKKTNPLMTLSNDDKHYENMIINKSLEYTVKDILFSLCEIKYKGSYPHLTDDVEMANISRITELLAKIISGSTNYPIIFESYQKYKNRFRLSIANFLSTIVNEYDNFYTEHNGESLIAYLLILNIFKKEGVIFIHSDDNTNIPQARLPKDLFENEDELKAQLTPALESINSFFSCSFMAGENFKTVMKHKENPLKEALPEDMIDEIAIRL